MTVIFDQRFAALLAEAEVHPFGQSRGLLEFETLRAYVRIGRRCLPDGTFPSCVQLASFNIDDEQNHHKGTFTRMLARIMEATGKPIFVESVLNREFGDALLRRGFVVVSDPMEGISRDLVLYRSE